MRGEKEREREREREGAATDQEKGAETLSKNNALLAGCAY